MRLPHNLKVLGSIPGKEFFESFFVLKCTFLQNDFMFHDNNINIKNSYESFWSVKNVIDDLREHFKMSKFSKF